MMGIDDDYMAWCVDEAMLEFDTLMGRGKKLKPRDTRDNTALLREAGVLE